MNSDVDTVAPEIDAFIKESVAFEIFGSGENRFRIENLENLIYEFVKLLDEGRTNELEEPSKHIVDEISKSMVRECSVYKLFAEHSLIEAIFSILKEDEITDQVKISCSNIVLAASYLPSFRQKLNSEFLANIHDILYSLSDELREAIYSLMVNILNYELVNNDLSTNLMLRICSLDRTNSSMKVVVKLAENCPLNEELIDILYEYASSCSLHDFLSCPVPYTALSLCISHKPELCSSLFNEKFIAIFQKTQCYDKEVSFARIKFMISVSKTEYFEYIIHYTNWIDMFQSYINVNSVEYLTSLLLAIIQANPDSAITLIDAGMIHGLVYNSSSCPVENGISMRNEVIKALSILLPNLPQEATTLAINAGLEASVVQLVFENPTNGAFDLLILLIEHVKKVHQKEARKLLEIIDKEGNFSEIAEECDDKEIEEKFRAASESLEDLRAFVESKNRKRKSHWM
jgi:hypothetical protein